MVSPLWLCVTTRKISKVSLGTRLDSLVADEDVKKPLKWKYQNWTYHKCILMWLILVKPGKIKKKTSWNVNCLMKRNIGSKLVLPLLKVNLLKRYKPVVKNDKCAENEPLVLEHLPYLGVWPLVASLFGYGSFWHGFLVNREGFLLFEICSAQELLYAISKYSYRESDFG